MSTFKSCHCQQCSACPSKIKKEEKRKAHRKMRRESKKAIQKEEEAPQALGCGRPG